MLTTVIIAGTFILFFIILGILLSIGKGSFLIAGFNTLPKEEKDKYDKLALCKFMGKIMFALAICQLFWLLDSVLDINILSTIGTILLLVVIVFALIYANTGNRFKNE